MIDASSMMLFVVTSSVALGNSLIVHRLDEQLLSVSIYATCFLLALFAIQKTTKYLVKHPGQFCFMMQAEINDLHLQTVSGKLPPGWDPSRDKAYPFRHWLADLNLWANATDAPVARQGPMVALRLAGPAKIMVREMDADVLAGGAVILDGNGQQIQITGLQFLVRELQRRFAPLAQETQLHAISELLQFKRMQNESTDALISRFDIVVHTAEGAGVQLGEQIKAWMIMNHLSIARDKWAMLLAPTQGALPQNAGEYIDFILYLRRQGHLYDGGDAQRTIRQPYFATSFDESQVQPAYWQTAAEHEPSWHNSQSAFVSEPIADTDVYSSGCSDADEEVNLDDIADMSLNQAGEHLYLEYRSAKRRFRTFSSHGSRKGKGKGKGKRKSKRAAKTVRSFWAGAPESEEIVEWVDEEYVVPDMFSYYKGKGTGGKGSGKGKSGGTGTGRLNPIGPDGKVMTCSVPNCGSEYHFHRNCPKKLSMGKGKGSSSLNPSSTGYFSQPPVPGFQPMYLTGPTSAPEGVSKVTFADGTEEFLQLSPAQSQPNQSFVGKMLTFMMMLGRAFHATVKLKNSREGVLVDCGAIDNLCGDKWARRVEKLGNAAGQGSQWKATRALSVEGVGSGASTVDKEVTLPLCLMSGSVAQYHSNVVSSSELPGLLGLVSLERNSAVIDIGHQRLIYPGPGGFEIKLSPGSVMMALEKAESGHLLLPCSEWQNAKVKGSQPLALF